MYNVEKWSNILLKSCSVNPARFLKYVCPIFNIMYERVKSDYYKLRNSKSTVNTIIKNLLKIGDICSAKNY